MSAGPMDLGPLSLDLPEGTSDKIPGIAYTVPDLDANVRQGLRVFLYAS
jgi:hypothetical protein